MTVLGALVRNRPVLRVVTAYALFSINEYSVWIAVLIYAFQRGGTTETGIIAVVQLVPAALLAPVMAVRADRGSPVEVLLSGYGCQIAGLMIAAVAADAHWPAIVFYAGATVAATSVTATRPGQAVLLPGLARTADELTAANVVVSWLDAGGSAAAGLWAAALLVFGVGQVLFAAVGLLAIAALLVAGLRSSGTRSDEPTDGVRAELRAGARAIAVTPGARSLVGLLFAGSFLVGALDVLYVVIAIALLHEPRQWVGYLNSVYGFGGLLAGALALMLVGRRLPGPILTAALTMAAGLVLIAAFPHVASVLVLLALIGAALSLYDVACRTLLQRTVPAEVIGRAFGLVEGSAMAALAVGSITVPVLSAFGGVRGALVGLGVLLLLGVAACARTVLRLDRESRIPVVEISLLRSVRILSMLPGPVLEGLARALTPRAVRAGEVLIREGDAGDAFYAIADGRFRVSRAGRTLRDVGRGDGVGEIALLRDVPRTASVAAETDALVYTLPREAFLVATTGHAPTHLLAHEVAQSLLDDGGPGEAPR